MIDIYTQFTSRHKIRVIKSYSDTVILSYSHTVIQ